MQPQSQTVAPGRPVGLPVPATGTRPSYQWFQNGRALPGATSAVLAFDSVSEANAGDYTVNVTQSGVYSIATRLASQNGGGTFHIEIDGVNVSASITVPKTNGTQS